MSKYNEKSSLKGIMKPQDVHCFCDAKNHTLKCFDSNGKWKWTIPVHCEGVAGPGWDHPHGDTPPGLYKIGVITESQNNESASVWNAFGKYFCDLVELENQEINNGRAGCGVHGGGSASPDPLAPKQGWYKTEGCARLQNYDLENIFVPMCRFVKKNNGTVFFRVMWS